MAPHAPRGAAAAKAEPDPPTEQHEPVKGPHPGYLSIASQYISEQKLRQMQREMKCDQAREDTYRLQGVQLIDNIRQSLQLPVKTFDTACTYYHKFRLCFKDTEYAYPDAAVASLFVACKADDTLKKSRELLCTHHNLTHRGLGSVTSQDDKALDGPAKIVIGLERLILETIGFDFRERIPQHLIVKIVKDLLPQDKSREFIATAYPMLTDLYKTFAPIKQTSFTMVMAVIELAALVTDTHVDRVHSLDLGRYHTSRATVVETILDLLDLYTQHQKNTKIGTRFDLDRFIEIKIGINHEVERTPGLSRFSTWCDDCEAETTGASSSKTATPGSTASPGTKRAAPPPPDGNGERHTMGSIQEARKRNRGQDGTMRFVFDAAGARQEQRTVDSYFKDEYEEQEIETEERVRDEHHGSNRNNNNNHNGGRSHGPGAPRRDRGHGHGHHPYNHHGSDWPYSRDRHHGSRPKGRKGGHY